MSSMHPAIPGKQGITYRRFGIPILAAAILFTWFRPAAAAFSGRNGQIAYEGGGSGSQIYLTGSGQLTFPPLAIFDENPAFSSDGSKVAFTRRTGDRSSSYLMTINAVGTFQQEILSSAGFGGVVEHPAWADSQRVTFAIQGASNPLDNGIWTMGGPEGLTQTRQMAGADFPNWSPGRNELVHTCTFRESYVDLCTYQPDTKKSRQLTIEWPGRLTFGLGNPKWSPDGDRIVFSMEWNDNGVVHHDIFSINRVGTDLKKLTDSGASICPTVPGAWATYTYGAPSPSPDGQWVAVMRWTNIPNPDPNDSARCGAHHGTQDHALFRISADGGGDTLVPNSANMRFGTDWQPVPASLTVDVNDGHFNPLKGLKVELFTAGGTLRDDHPSNVGGKYLFDSVAQGEYKIRATLVDNDVDGTPAFDIRHTESGTEPVWIEVQHSHGDASRAYEVSIPFDSSTQIVASNVAQEWYERLDDMANLYFSVGQFVEWVKAHLVPDTLDTVEYYTFATRDPDPERPSLIGSKQAWYNPSTSAVVVGDILSTYDSEEERAEAMDWHEFTHHLFDRFVRSAEAPCHGTFDPHAGYFNDDTCSSMDEGFAGFLPTFANREINGVSDAMYATFGRLDNAEIQPWTPNSDNPGASTDEEIAIAGLLWDLTDVEINTRDGSVIGADGLTHIVVYADDVYYSLQQLWARMTELHPVTVFMLHRMYGLDAPTIDLDGDWPPDVSSWDQVFLMHGFFPIDTDQTPIGIPRELPSYRYDVGYAQRGNPSAPRNDAVGYSSHHAYDASGKDMGLPIPRNNLPLQPTANIGLQVRDASGTPLDAVTVKLGLRYPNGEAALIDRSLAHGSGGLVHLELPSYYDYLQPIGSALPACDPVHDFQVQVTLRAEKAGILSNETPTFDNCAYQHAMAAATGSAALSYALTIPVQTLTVLSTGSGLGKTTGGGTYPVGQTVSVSATAYAGSVFTGWSGPHAAQCASGSVVLNANQSCTATFSLTRILTTSGTGTGSGSVTGSGVYVYGQTASVTATPTAGSVFTGWSGPDAAECATGFVLMTANKTCTAGFTLNDGTCQPGFAVPQEVRSVAFAADKQTISWASAPYATSYDVVRGSLSALPVGPGDGDEACIGSLVAGVSTTDSALPAPGTAFYYVVRGKNACGQGAYGSQSNITPRSTTTCLDCLFLGTPAITPVSSPPSLSMSQQSVAVYFANPQDNYTQARLQITKTGGSTDFDQIQVGTFPSWGFTWTPGQGFGDYVATATVTNSTGCTRSVTNTWTVEPPSCASCAGVLAAAPDATTTPQYYRLQDGLANSCSFPLEVTGMTVRESSPTTCTQASCVSPMKLVKIQYLASGSFADETSNVVWTSGISGGSPVAAPSTVVTASFAPALTIGANTSGAAKVRLIFNTTTPIWTGTQANRKHTLFGDVIFSQSSGLCTPSTIPAQLD